MNLIVLTALKEAIKKGDSHGCRAIMLGNPVEACFSQEEGCPLLWIEYQDQWAGTWSRILEKLTDEELQGCLEQIALDQMNRLLHETENERLFGESLRAVKKEKIPKKVQDFQSVMVDWLMRIHSIGRMDKNLSKDSIQKGIKAGVERYKRHQLMVHSKAWEILQSIVQNQEEKIWSLFELKLLKKTMHSSMEKTKSSRVARTGRL